MNKQTKQLVGGVLIVGVLYLLYKQYQKNKAAAPAAAPASTTSDSNTANIVGAAKWIVGGYDAVTNTTYVFPEGNLGGGRRIAGRLNVQQGQAFYPSFPA